MAVDLSACMWLVTIGIDLPRHVGIPYLSARATIYRIIAKHSVRFANFLRLVSSFNLVALWLVTVGIDLPRHVGIPYLSARATIYRSIIAKHSVRFAIVLIIVSTNRYYMAISTSVYGR